MYDITFNCLALRPQGSGVQTYIRQLLAHLGPERPDWRLHAVVQADAVGELPSGVRPVVRPSSVRTRRAVGGLRAVGPTDLVHGLDVAVPLLRRTPTVATVHDLAVFDLPWTVDRVRAAGERLLVQHAVRSADALIAVSEFTAERINVRLHRSAFVVPEAPGPEMYPPSDEEVADCRMRYQLPDSFALYVGDLGPRKGLSVLTAACRDAGVALVVAGGYLGNFSPLGALVLGYVPAEDLRALYGAATVFAFPSRYEGFGLPPLEAMACGTPVLASRIPALVEILGDAARLVPHNQPEVWAEALTDLWADADERAALATARRAKAARYSWTETARATAAVYRELGVG
jgi:glycosyltransferase involved in cell wall biosynthesis